MATTHNSYFVLLAVLCHQIKCKPSIAYNWPPFKQFYLNIHLSIKTHIFCNHEYIVIDEYSNVFIFSHIKNASF